MCESKPTRAELETTVDVLRSRVAELERAETCRAHETALLTHAHELLERVFAATHVCIAYMDRDFNFIRVNRAYAEADGRTCDFFTGKNHFDLYPNEENEAIFRRVVETGESTSFYSKPFEYAEHPERGVTYWDWSLHPVRSTSGDIDGVLLCLVNVTKREQAVIRAREHQSTLAQVSRVSTIGEMAGTLAHELSQPLGAIYTYADACKRMVKAGHLDELVSTIDKLAAQAQRAAGIMRQIRGFVGTGGPRKTRTSLDDLVQGVLPLADPEARKDGVTISLDLAGRVPDVLADPVQIQQVILNLIRNGIDAIRRTEAGPRGLTIRSAVAQNNSVQLSVIDTGAGLSDEASKRMFETFFTTKANGMGLGLAISRSIITGHGGRLWATPNDDRGTTFHFTIPFAPGGTDA